MNRNALLKNKWLFGRIVFYGFIILYFKFDGEIVSESSNVDWIAFCIIIPITILFSTFGIKMSAISLNASRIGASFLGAKKNWYLPSFKTLPVDLTNPPSWLFEAGNFVIARGLGAIIHCRFYDWTVFWVISIYIGIGLSMYLSLYFSTKIIRWKYSSLNR